LEIAVRLLTAEEEITTIANAKASVKIPENVDPNLFRAAAVMKAILEKAAFVDGTPFISMKFLDALTHQELNSLYDQYLSLVSAVSPEFEKMTDDEIAELIVA